MPKQTKKTTRSDKEITKIKEAKRQRKAYPSREERIGMAEAKIARLERLNANREALIAKTEEKLADRRAALEKSNAQYENAVALRERLIAAKDQPARGIAVRAAKAAEKAAYEELVARLGAQGKTVADLLEEMN